MFSIYLVKTGDQTTVLQMSPVLTFSWDWGKSKNWAPRKTINRAQSYNCRKSIASTWARWKQFPALPSPPPIILNLQLGCSYFLLLLSITFTIYPHMARSYNHREKAQGRQLDASIGTPASPQSFQGHEMSFSFYVSPTLLSFLLSAFQFQTLNFCADYPATRDRQPGGLNYRSPLLIQHTLGQGMTMSWASGVITSRIWSIVVHIENPR